MARNAPRLGAPPGGRGGRVSKRSSRNGKTDLINLVSISSSASRPSTIPVTDPRVRPLRVKLPGFTDGPFRPYERPANQRRSPSRSLARIVTCCKKVHPPATDCAPERALASSPRHSLDERSHPTPRIEFDRARMSAMSATLAAGAVRAGPAPARVSRKGVAAPGVRASAAAAFPTRALASTGAVRASRSAVAGRRVVSARCVRTPIGFPASRRSPDRAPRAVRLLRHRVVVRRVGVIIGTLPTSATAPGFFATRRSTGPA